MGTVNVDAMSREQLLQMQASARVYQERYDSALSPWDQRAPAPVLGQDLDSYRRETLVQMKKLLPDGHQLRIPVRPLRNDALDILEPQICRAVREEAYNPKTVPVDAPLRRVVEVDQNGMRIVKYIGQRSFVHDFTRPGRLAKIRNPDSSPGWFR